MTCNSSPDEFGNRLRSGAAEFGIALDDTAIGRFARFGELLADANQRVNLTRVDPSDFVVLHFLDSLSAASVWRPRRGRRVIDVGTGAGFPGLPLAIAFPDLRVTLLDGTQKKLDFIDAAIVELGLTNAQTLHGRAEEMARIPASRGAYDAAVARAVTRLPRLAGWLLPLVRPGGVAIAYKSGGAQAEIAEARQAIERGGMSVREQIVRLPGTDIDRAIVTICKPGGAASARRREDR